MKLIRVLLLLLVASQISGCFLTKVVTVPMRVGGAAVSLIPVVGNTMHDGIDTAAEAVDMVPL